MQYFVLMLTTETEAHLVDVQSARPQRSSSYVAPTLTRKKTPISSDLLKLSGLRVKAQIK